MTYLFSRSSTEVHNESTRLIKRMNEWMNEWIILLSLPLWLLCKLHSFRIHSKAFHSSVRASACAHTSTHDTATIWCELWENSTANLRQQEMAVKKRKRKAATSAACSFTALTDRCIKVLGLQRLGGGEFWAQGPAKSGPQQEGSRRGLEADTFRKVKAPQTKCWPFK